MALPDGRSPRINLIALPSLPGYYLGVMAVVILAAVISIARPGSPLRIGPALVVLFLTLVLRDFLVQPEREVRAHGLTRARDGEHDLLRQIIAEQARRAGLRRAPILWVSHRPGRLFVFGTFRHRHLAISHDLADEMEADWNSLVPQRTRRVEAALLHELQHFSQHDLLLVGLGRSLLRVGAAFCVLALAILMGMATLALAFPLTPLLDPALPAELERIQPGLGQIWVSITPPDFAQVVTAVQPPGLGLALLFLLNAFLPLGVTVTLMAVLVWPRLLRVRELYADAGAATRIGASTLWSALAHYGRPVALASAQRWRLERFAPPMGLTAVWQTTRRWFGPHPTAENRLRCLRQPAAILGTPAENGHWAGALSAMLDVLLVGAFTAIYAAQVPGVIPVVLGTLAGSFSLWPMALEGRAKPADAARAGGQVIGWVIAWRMGWHLLNLILLWVGALIAPALMSQALSGFVHSTAGALIHVPEGDVLPGNLLSLAIEASLFWLYLTVLIGISLAFTLALEWRTRRAALTWYALPGGLPALKWILAGINVWTLALVAGLGLPLIALAAPISPTDSFSVMGWTVLFADGVAVLAGALAFLRCQRKYGHRCPHCGAAISGEFALRHTACPACHKRMWPELTIGFGGAG